jgi:hypothetical protein
MYQAKRSMDNYEECVEKTGGLSDRDGNVFVRACDTYAGCVGEGGYRYLYSGIERHREQ